MPIYIYQDYPTLEEFLNKTLKDISGKNYKIKCLNLSWFTKYKFMHHYNEILKKQNFYLKNFL